MEITLILPNQLFASHPAISDQRPIWLVEEFLFFKVQPFHKQRMILLRAAMKEYEHFLKNQSLEVRYIESKDLHQRGILWKLLTKEKISRLHLVEATDTWFELDLKQALKKHPWTLQTYPSPMFLCTQEEITSFFKGKTHYSMASFYAYQRKKMNLLMEQGKPEGGKFSFDTENRKKWPKNLHPPKHPHIKQTKLVEEAILYVERNFPDSVGKEAPLLYPYTFGEAKKTLSYFIEHKLTLFGDYEDAIAKEEHFLFHSVLTPALNLGLLTPQDVIEEILAARKKHKFPLNSLEGFLRQVVGWREFMRGCYLLQGTNQRTKNYLKHKKPLPKGFWDGTTGIEPVDQTIRKVLETGYCHHIERLMILGNFLLLTETDPDAVYEWFMQFFVDAYDWVMVPNVYGMSQYADGGLMTTKPYFSSSNYILKMSDYKAGDWTEIWDGLFWRFMQKHEKLLSKNPRMNMLIMYLKKNEKEIALKISKANKLF